MSKDGESSLENMVNEQAFGEKKVEDLNLESSTPKVVSTEDEQALSENSENTEEANETLFESEMRLLKMDKDDILDMILQLSDNGEIRKNVSAFGGRVEAVLVSTKLSDTREFVTFFDKLGAKTQVMIDYYYNIYTLAQFLTEYKGETLDTDIHKKVKFIENTIPVPVYKSLHKEALKFARKSELLTFDEVADFF